MCNWKTISRVDAIFKSSTANQLYWNSETEMTGIPVIRPPTDSSQVWKHLNFQTRLTNQTWKIIINTTDISIFRNSVRVKYPNFSSKEKTKKYTRHSMNSIIKPSLKKIANRNKDVNAQCMKFFFTHLIIGACQRVVEGKSKQNTEKRRLNRDEKIGNSGLRAQKNVA